MCDGIDWKRKAQKKEGIDLHEYTIRAREERQNYKYIGVEEINQIEHRKMKNLHRDSYANNLKNTSTQNYHKKNSGNKYDANPKTQYSFGIIDWPKSEINKTDALTLKLLTQQKIFYKDQCHARLHTPRARSCMSLIELDVSHKTT